MVETELVRTVALEQQLAHGYEQCALPVRINRRRRERKTPPPDQPACRPPLLDSSTPLTMHTHAQKERKLDSRQFHRKISAVMPAPTPVNLTAGSRRSVKATIQHPELPARQAKRRLTRRFQQFPGMACSEQRLLTPNWTPRKLADPAAGKRVKRVMGDRGCRVIGPPSFRCCVEDGTTGYS